MRTTIDLNSEDIRAIIALHFGVKTDAVKVFADTVYPYEPGEDSYEVAKATVRGSNAPDLLYKVCPHCGRRMGHREV